MRKTPARSALLGVVALGVALTVVGCGKTIGETIDDGTITARVKTALLSDESVAGLRIDVDTFKGVVTLSGSVRTEAESARAVEIANSISGVTDVNNSLQVIPPAQP